MIERKKLRKLPPSSPSQSEICTLECVHCTLAYSCCWSIAEFDFSNACVVAPFSVFRARFAFIAANEPGIRFSKNSRPPLSFSPSRSIRFFKLFCKLLSKKSFVGRPAFQTKAFSRSVRLTRLLTRRHLSPDSLQHHRHQLLLFSLLATTNHD